MPANLGSIGGRIKGRIAGALRPNPAGASDIPTVALYFGDPLADLIGKDDSDPGRPIVREAPTLFTCRSTLVVIRYVTAAQIAALRNRRFDRLYLMIDDNFAALDENDGLPAEYRRKLVDYRDGPLRDIMPRVTHVVAPSESILANYPGKVPLLLDPAQCHAIGDLNHHPADKVFDILFAGSRSHLEDLALVAAELAVFLKANPAARLTTFLKDHVPPPLRAVPNAVHLPAMSWARYREFVATHRFHVAIAPARETPFNRSRSISKLHDHAAFGAAGLYSDQPPFSAHIRNGVSGLLLPNEPRLWRAALESLARTPTEAARLAAEGQALSRRLGDPLRVRAFWTQALGLA